MGSKSGYKRKLLSREKEESKKKKLGKVQILAYRHARKQEKPLLNYIHRKLCLNFGNSFLVILMPTDLKTVDVNRSICVAFISRELKN